MDASTKTETKTGVLASFSRFVLFGGGTGIASSGALVLLSGSLPIAVANAFVTVVSTVIATELHSRFTFNRGRADLKAHLQSASTAVVCYLFTTAAVLGLHALVENPSVLLDQGVYLTASGLAGIGRFAALRVLVFATRNRKVTTAVGTTQTTRTTAPALARDAVAAVA